MADEAVDLITLKEYHTYTGKEPDRKQFKEAQAALIISAASVLFADLTGRKLIQAADAYEFKGRGELTKYVRYPPITGTPVIAYYNVNTWTTADTTTYPREIVESDRIRMTSSAFGRNIRWRISYTGGYLIAAVPADIKVAVCQLVDRAVKRAQGKEAVSSETLADHTTTFTLSKLLTEPIMAVVNKYKVVS